MSGNLFRKDYEPAFLKVWEGCAHLHCPTQCQRLHGHCERLKLAYEKWKGVRHQEPEPSQTPFEVAKNMEGL